MDTVSRALQGLSPDENINVSAYNSTIGPIVGIVVIIMLFYYAEAGTPIHTYVTVFMCYYSAFMFMFLVPADVGSTVLYRRGSLSGEDSNYNDMVDLFRPQYETYYLVITILSGSVLLFQEYYNTDGYFTVGDRCKSVLRRMGYEYAIYCAVGVIIFGVLVGNGADANALVLTLILVANTCNLFLLMFILGFGLIAFPLKMWNKSDIHRLLHGLQNNAAAQFSAVNDLMLDHAKVVADLRKTKERLESMQSAPQLLKVAEDMLKKCPDELRSTTLGVIAFDKEGHITLDTLAQLNTRLKEHRLRYQLAQSKLDTIKLGAYRAEDVIKCMDDLAEFREQGGGWDAFDKRIYWSISKTYSSTLEFYWWTQYRNVYYKCIAIIFTVLVIFCYMGIFGSFKGAEKDVSVYYSATHSDHVSGGGIAVFVLMTLGFVATVTSWSLFQFRFSGIMEMVPYRTTPTSLSFNARMVGRLAPPLAFFYLGWIFENGIREGAWLYNDGIPPIKMTLAFSHFYKVDVLPLVGDLTVILPVILLITSALVLLNIFNRVMVWLRLPTYQFGIAIVTDEQLKEGKRQIERHRKLMERAARRYSFKNLLRGQQDDPEVQGTNICQRCYRYLFRRWYDNRTLEDEADVKEAMAGTLIGDAAADREPEPPASVADTLERKAGKNIMSSKWQNKHFVLSKAHTGYLVFWKNEKESMRGKPEEGSYNLATATDFKVNESGSHAKNAKLKLEISFSDQDAVVLRFKTVEDIEKWRNALFAWKNYSEALRIYKANRPMSVNVRFDSGQERPASPTANPMSPDNRKRASTRSSFASVDDYESYEDDMHLNAHMDLNAALDSIDVGEVDVDLDRGIIVSDIEGLGDFNDDAGGPMIRHSSVSSTTSAVPPILEGWLERCEDGLMTTYKKRYCRVDPDMGTFLVYENKIIADASGEPTFSMDIRTFERIKPHTIPHGRISAEGFTLADGTRTEKFKIPPSGKDLDWVNALNNWNDYLLLSLV